VQPYQEEYLSNLQQFAALSQLERPGGLTGGEYAARVVENHARLVQLGRRNMELLRTGLFPSLDNLFIAGQDEIKELEQFANQLYDGRQELDACLAGQIHQSLLALARQKEDLDGIVRELYWLGMSRYCLVRKLVGLSLPDVQEYASQMRQSFAEAAAYLKYFDVIQNAETRGYILRSRANVALGTFPSPSEKIDLLKKSLAVFQDKRYQDADPTLPWDRFVYLVHQNITSSIPHDRREVLSPEDMAVIMESTYIVYQKRFDEAEMQGKQPPAKSAFAYYSIEYYCGFYGLDVLLSRMESLLEAADPADYSPDGMYGMISLPAFYSQCLSRSPKSILPRKEYIDGLYRRVLDYVDACPGAPGDENLFIYLRQLSFTYIETGEGVPYGELLQRLLLRFAPEIYCHCHAVGEGARAFCDSIMEDEPGFFDDIDFIREISNPSEKRQAVLDYAFGCGAFHDVGKISLIELYFRTPRQWFEEEYRVARLHTVAGQLLLSPRPSTSRYADAALGHHAWYDGSRGYPNSYRRPECPARQMVDVIGLVNFLEEAVGPSQMNVSGPTDFDEAAQAASKLEGQRFSPLLTTRLQDPRTAARVKAALEDGRKDAHRRMYEDALRSG